MDIRRARKIAEHVNNQTSRHSKQEKQAAFQRLHRSAECGNKNDRDLAKVIWHDAGRGSNE